ncbi:23S rRNA (uracil-5-)-methyltransferase RumA [Lactobacillus iners LactinV 11V1-d]|nr:23S rRNA (uracil-5-)-methyltransferase RumA [Lactobacillus iners LactinV 11V1-d]
MLFKKELIKDSLLKFHPRNYQKIKIKNTIPAPKQWYYRNKAQYQIESIKNKISLGMYAPKSQKIIDLPIMPTQSKNTQKVEFAIKKLIEKMHIAIADSRYKKDGIKTVVVRQSHATDEIQVTLVTIGKNIKNLDKLAEKIIELENVVSVFQNESQWNNPLVWGNKTTKLIGKNYITEQILNKKFILSPRAFFQLNPEQTEVLYSTALNYLELNANSILVDAYAGVGTLGILASEKVKQVIGIESIPEAIADAQFNCRLNNVKNAEYINGSVEKILPQMQKDGIAIDALIVDPPRTGLNKQLVKTLLTCKPKDFVYISCNPSTLARDLVLLSQAYDVRLIQPVDMMPQTPRWEGIAKLVLRK